MCRCLPLLILNSLALLLLQRGGGADVFHNLQLRLQTTRAESEPQREKPTKNSIVTMKIMKPASTTVEKDQKKDFEEKIGLGGANF